MINNILIYFYISMRSAFAYKRNFIGSLLLTAIAIFFRIKFSDSLFQFSDNIGGWKLIDVYSIVITITYISLLTHTFAASVNNFFQYMLIGKIDPLFMQPVPILFHMILRWMSGVNLIVFILLSIYFLIFFPLNFSMLNYYEILSVCITVICSVIANVAFVILLNSFSLVGQKLLPVEYIHVELNKMQIIPPTLFGENTFKALIFLMPIAVSAGVVVLASKQPFSLIVLLFWLASIIFFLSSYYFFQFFFKRRVTQGG